MELLLVLGCYIEQVAFREAVAGTCTPLGNQKQTVDDMLQLNNNRVSRRNSLATCTSIIMHRPSCKW